MAKILIQGGKPLNGSIIVSGAKNAALPIMAATLLSTEPVVLRNVPDLNDVNTMAKVLQALGVNYKKLDHGVYSFNASGAISEEAPYELVKTMRASFFVMGPLLARLKKARVPLPGGCAIGVRPVNIHLKGFEALGARVSIDGGCAVAVADRLVGNKIMLDFPSVGATENLMMAAALAEGQSVIENAAQEPEIIDLANFLNALGAKISGAGSPIIKIDGVEKLKGGEYSIIPDRIEAGTFMVLGAISGGRISVEKCEPEHQHALMNKLKEMGAEIEIDGDKVVVSAVNGLNGVEVKTLPFPGFPTDMQAQLMVAMCVANGSSFITETIFENRFMHVSELARMGANVTTHDRTAVIHGVKSLKGAPVSATDLRAGAAMVLAGLIAEGKTEISQVYHIDRGYEDLTGRLRKLGANIERIEDPETDE
ncbi:MAG: UDP-N-acetylglucosamine 1-carboxyvinyltransferase [Clostridiales bacterium]|jgi:UDP-N-acetylglucosamine 1-carboxyvinyltransferase|nr:UDP-N-acetylglucosamine 1-carboxyvinyltransferase [Clostridiales bacterium]MDN5281911.1 UDP-N-acetylglucosamine 1-carboxyvinyltransferase [Candidatus Ozemobacter sp.]